MQMIKVKLKGGFVWASLSDLIRAYVQGSPDNGFYAVFDFRDDMDEVHSDIFGSSGECNDYIESVLNNIVFIGDE